MSVYHALMRFSINQVAVQWGLIVSVILSTLEVSYGLLRYTAPMNASIQYLGYGVAGIGLISFACEAGIWSARPHSTLASKTLQDGVMLGLIIAVVWAANILVTHFLLTNAEKPTLGTLLVTITFLSIFVLVLGRSGYSAYQTRQIGTGIRIGLWSGLIAGVFTTMLILFMLSVSIDFLLQRMNDGEIQAFLHSGIHDKTAWFFWEEFSGSMGYLVTNLFVGGVTGLIGGLIGKGVVVLAQRIKAA